MLSADAPGNKCCFGVEALNCQCPVSGGNKKVESLAVIKYAKWCHRFEIAIHHMLRRKQVNAKLYLQPFLEVDLGETECRYAQHRLNLRCSQVVVEVYHKVVRFALQCCR